MNEDDTHGYEITWPSDPEVVLIAGDWHGNDRAAKAAIQAARAAGTDTIIQLGDFGLWPGDEGRRYLDNVNAAAETAGVHIAWIDGNHEDFTQLQTPPGSDGISWQREHIGHIRRGSRWQWAGVTFCALGGATSLDRAHRTIGKSWWPEEAVNNLDLAHVAAGGHTDVLVTHDAPTGVHIPHIHHRDYTAAARSGWPISELERAWEHRDRVLEAVTATTPKHLWHGHYHTRYTQTAQLHPSGDTHVEGLSWDGDGVGRNTAVAVLRDAVQVHNTHQYIAHLNASAPGHR